MWKQKLSGASESDKVVDNLSGYSKVEKWQESAENEEAEVVFYNMIMDNCLKVLSLVTDALHKSEVLGKSIQETACGLPDEALSDEELRLEEMIGEAKKISKDAEHLAVQWANSIKDYPCGAPPSVNNVASQCTKGNTKFSPKCAMTCEVGYDGKGTANKFRCRKQGKFVKQLYGEWMGSAVCV